MDLAQLYRDVIVDHNRSPRNRGKLPAATASGSTSSWRAT
jgi:NifU-like protein involved in Fe-S cluster formation